LQFRRLPRLVAHQELGYLKERNTMKRLALLLSTGALALVAVATPAAAQDLRKIEVSGGYNFLRFFDDALDGDEKNFTKGWYADVAGNLTSMFAVVGQVTGNYKTVDDVVDIDLDAHTFLGGVRVSSRQNARVIPFGQVLAGAARASASALGVDESETDGALQLGGGVNIMPTPNLGVRLGLDYLRVFSEDEGTNVFRFAAGVVVGFGAR
jgi:opacity protein-like surface antigen